MKNVITTFIYGDEKADIPPFRVENPPVDIVEN
jgi:hypothetical protein